MTAALGAAPSAVPVAAPRRAAVASVSVDSVARMAPATSLAATPAMTDADLDGLVAVLDALPEDIKSADPRTTPDYERRLSRAMEATTSARQSTRADASVLLGLAPRHLLGEAGRIGAPTQVELATDWIACGAAVAGVIAQYGIPVVKVLGWIREAREIWQTAYGIYVAIRDGVFAVQMGEEAAQLLGAILGVDGVASAYFSSAAVTA
ncbi:MAG: hypothetical protein HDR73_15195 [Clavibacter sp.]|nr:hypothetical protein [Clavibacter sp.]